MITWKKLLKEWVIPLAAEVLIILLLIRFICFLALVPTGSMIPTIAERSWLFVTRMYEPEKSVRRGDILVFESDELKETLIKRVVGLPGDDIRMDGRGSLYVNGEYYPEPYVTHSSGKSGEWRVPDGCFLFMGDNRADSYDSRFWQMPYVPGSKISGKARVTLWPPSNFGLLE